MEKSLELSKTKPDPCKKPRILRKANQIPEEILNNEELNREISWLPSNYNFEIHKTIWKIRQSEAQCVALQFPEGLQMFALTISDIVEKHTGAETIILGDVTYGACCVDDFTARNLGADFLVHYGHSCLIPVSCTKGIKTLYVFVDIQLDVLHFVNTIKLNFSKGSKLAMVSTVQFVKSLHAARTVLSSDYDIIVPQSKPLTPGEILGCTAPKLDKADGLVYLGDGRFHLEAIMIANPSLPAYRYDPYGKELTHEHYETLRLMKTRLSNISKAESAETFGIILGTLGRQGNLNVTQHLQDTLQQLQKRFIVVLLSEIFPAKLELFKGIEAWIQTACPRLSMDWGSAFSRPLLNTYEAATTLKQIEWKEQYPMDYYSYGSLGKWTPNHKPT